MKLYTRVRERNTKRSHKSVFDLLELVIVLKGNRIISAAGVVILFVGLLLSPVLETAGVIASLDPRYAGLKIGGYFLAGAGAFLMVIGPVLDYYALRHQSKAEANSEH